MAIFYRGAGVGTWWHPGVNDPRVSGFTPQSPGVQHSNDQVMLHITRGTTTSPYVSLTRSWGVAQAYAMFFGRGKPTPAAPAYVWEIELNVPLPMNLTLIDPVKEVASNLPTPVTGVSYQHDGAPNSLIALIDTTQQHLILAPSPMPPGSNPPARATTVTRELQTLMFALRDAEILVVGTIPASCIRGPHPVS